MAVSIYIMRMTQGNTDLSERSSGARMGENDFAALPISGVLLVVDLGNLVVGVPIVLLEISEIGIRKDSLGV